MGKKMNLYEFQCEYFIHYFIHNEFTIKSFLKNLIALTSWKNILKKY